MADARSVKLRSCLPAALLLVMGCRSPLSTAAAAGPGDAVELGVGRAHTCARTRAGQVRCWGSNRSGQLGDGTRAARATPGPVLDLPAVAALAIGREHNCARTAEGQVYCWGDGYRGALGDGTGQSRDRPVHIEGVSGAIDLVAGSNTTCARESTGTVKCWGGLLPHGIGDGQRPLELPALRGARMLALLPEHGFALMPDARVLEWGSGDAPGSPPRPFHIRRADGGVREPAPISALTGVRWLGGSGSRVCVRTAQGEVACWGDPCGGEQQRKLDGLHAYGVKLATAQDALAVGEAAACAYSPRAPLRCWCVAEGWAPGTRLTPELGWVWQGPQGVQAVALGEQHSCILGSDARISCWGTNEDGQLGDGARTRRHRGQVALPATAVEIAAGTWHACARLDNGTIECWGQGEYGQLGDGGSAVQPRPVKVVGLSGATALAARAQQACAIVAGKVYCWGAIPVPLRADGRVQMARAPVRVAGVDSAVALALGAQHGCALLRDGSVRCWGENHSYQLGDGSTTPRAEAAPVTGLGPVSALTASDFNTCAITSDGRARCWGRGRLDGRSPESQWRVPTALPGVAEVAEVRLEELHGCIRHRSGELRCWDSLGRLAGAPPTATPEVLSIEPRGSGATQVRVFQLDTCVGLATGGFRCWGGNAWGELQPAESSSTEPPASYALDIADAVELAGGMGFLCARTRSGAVFCQGSSQHGEAGDGTADRDRPTPVRW